jgi:alpha-galactosidase/6-phospho-beta-glucosidase family protein
MAYADENYVQKKNLYDVLSQVFENYKYGATSIGHSWNQPLDQVRGVTMRYLGENLLELTYHRYEVTTVEGLERMKRDNDGEKFVTEVVKQLKKEFKSETGKDLTMKKVKGKPIYFEKAGRVSGEKSFLYSSTTYGHGARAVGRYLAKTSCIYDFSAKL